MSRERTVGWGILAAGVLVALFVGGLLMANSARGLRFTVTFEDGKDLKRGDRVQLNGVDIGVVQYVQLHTQPTRIDVGVKIDPEHVAKVRADATATIGGTAFPNVSGQKVVEIINSETDPPYEPIPSNAVVKGMDNALELGSWKLKKKLEGKKEDWQRRLDLMRDSLRQNLDQIEQIRTSPKVKETLSQLRDFVDRMRKEGHQAVVKLSQEWGPLKEKLQPILKELTDFGRQYLVQQIQRVERQIDETLQRWREAAPETPVATPVPGAGGDA